MIRLRGVRKIFESGGRARQVLRGVDLDIESGQYVALVGRSGSGKTTLLHLLAGLDRDFEGTVEVSGRSLSSLSDQQLSELRNRSIGFVYQAFHLLEHLSCSENVALPALFARGPDVLGRGAARARALEVLEQVGLGDRAEARPSQLSGGEKQRVGLARALFNRPPIVLCDELTGNLDQRTGAVILDLLRSVHEQSGITLVVATHDAEISSAADRVLELDGGEIHEDVLRLAAGSDRE